MLLPGSASGIKSLFQEILPKIPEPTSPPEPPPASPAQISLVPVLFLLLSVAAQPPSFRKDQTAIRAAPRDPLFAPQLNPSPSLRFSQAFKSRARLIFALSDAERTTPAAQSCWKRTCKKLRSGRWGSEEEKDEAGGSLLGKGGWEAVCMCPKCSPKKILPGTTVNPKSRSHPPGTGRNIEKQLRLRPGMGLDCV